LTVATARTHTLPNAELLRELSADRALASATLFDHRHPQKSPPFHVKIMDLWRCADEFVAIQVFREGAKSTLSEEFLALEGCFANSPYTLIIGETYDKGCQRLDSIKAEISGNEKLRQLFGRLKGSIWNENFIELANGAVLQAAGWDQEHRGYNHRGTRPHRAYLDDIENKSLVRDSETVQQQWSRLWTELLPALDKIHRKLRITGTPLADDCLITRCCNDASFVPGVFPICTGDLDDPETESLWPDRYPMDWIRSERDKYARAGELLAFNQEYLLIAAQTAGKPFREDQIRYQALPPPGWSRRIAIIDPARTTNVHKSAETGSVVVSRIGSTIYVHESDGKFQQPSAIVESSFEMSERHGGAQVCIEKNGLDEWLMQPFRTEMLRRGVTLPLKAIQAPQSMDKDAFIAGLEPFFNAGDIVLIGDRVKHAKLVAQIANYPSGRKDVINALAYAPKVFGGEPIYADFGEANIADDLEPDKDAILYIGVTGDATATCAVLVSVEGQCLSVLADWTSGLVPQDALKDIATVCRAAYPKNRLNACVPADIFDQQQRNPIVRTLQRENIRVFRGAFSAAARAALMPLIRTEMRGRRMLRVDSRARNTLQALAGGYQYPINRGARQGGEPEAGQYRFVAEALETLTSGIVSAHNDALPEGVNMATNPTGSSYMTSLPRRGTNRR